MLFTLGLPAECVLPYDEGSGPVPLPRWYFSSDTGKCEIFPYLGNGGNANRFDSEAACEAACRGTTENSSFSTL